METLDTLSLLGNIDRGQPEILFETLQTLLDVSPAMIFVKDCNLAYVAATPSFAEMLGKGSVPEILGKKDIDLFEDKAFSKRFTADDKKLFATQKNLINYVEQITDKDGSARYVNTSKYLLSNKQGETIGLLGVSRDITKDIKAKKQHQKELHYLFNLPSNAYTAIYIDVEDWRVIGQRYQRVNHYKVPLFDTMDFFLSRARNHIVDESCDAYVFYQEFSQKQLADIYESGETLIALEYLRRFDGKVHWVRDEINFLTDPETGHLCVMIIVRDIDNQRRVEEELLKAASTDRMTGLLNRSALEGSIEKFLEDARLAHHAAFMIDIDNFKEVNDTLGHPAGDQLLIDLAVGIKSCFRESDLICRLGGDEFFVLMKHTVSFAAVKKRADKLLKVLQKICAKYHTAGLSASIGISIYPEDGKTLTDLYQQADKALYKAKRQGKNQIAFFEAA